MPGKPAQNRFHCKPGWRSPTPFAREYPMQPHELTVDGVLDNLKSTRAGLTAAEARLRLERFGPNELVEGKKKSPLAMFLSQFTDFFILVLIAAAVISGIIGELSDTIAIVVIVVLN